MSLPFITNAIAEAWGMTLLHSLWQGAAWSVLLFVALRFVHRSESRYAAGLMALGGFLVSISVTAGLVFFPEASSPVLAADNEPQQLIAFVAAASGEGSLLPSISAVMPWFVNFWALGTFLFIVRMAAGMHYMYRIRQRGSNEIPEAWMAMIDRIAADLNIKRRPMVINSMHVDMPLVYGYLKPVLFLPVSYLSGLSSAQLEAVFAHELAHIRRHDFLVNLVQRFIEAVFFFNPFIWWISKSINADRERCCDDLAVRYSSDSHSYVRALSTLEVYRCGHAGMAMGLASDRSDLLHRMKRLVEPDYRQGGQYRLVLLAMLFSFIWFGFSLIGKDNVDEKTESHTIGSKLEANILPSNRYAIKQLAADTIPPKEFITQEEMNRIQKAISDVKLPDMNNFTFPEIDTVELGKQIEIAANSIDFEESFDLAMEVVEEINFDVVMENALDGLEDIDFNFDLDTNIVLRDTLEDSLSREELRKAREELRQMQRELNNERRMEMQKLREEMMRAREEHRGEWQKMREEFQKVMEEMPSLTPEERARLRTEMSEARKLIAEEMARVQEEMARMHQEQESVIQEEMQEAQRQIERAQREVELAQQEIAEQKVEMERHQVFLNRIEEQLRADGYLERGESLKTLKISDKDISFNNRKVLNEDLENYREIFKEFFGKNSSGTYEYEK